MNRAISNKLLGVISVLCFLLCLIVGIHKCGLWADTQYWLDADEKFVSVGSTTKLYWVNAPKHVLKSKVKVKLSGSDKAVVSTSKSGKAFKLKGIKDGEVTVKVYYKKKKVGAVRVYIISNAINNQNISLDVYDTVKLRLKYFIKPKEYSKQGIVKWKSSNKRVKIKQSKSGNICSVKVLQPGCSTVKAFYNNKCIGECKINIKDKKYIESKGKDFILKSSDFDTKYSNGVIYSLSLDGGSLFSVNSSVKWVNKPINSIFLYDDWSERIKCDKTLSDKEYRQFSIRATQKGKELIQLEYNNKIYKFNITVLSDDIKTIKYEEWLQDYIDSTLLLSEIEKVKFICRKIKSFDYMSAQTDRYKMLLTGSGNCWAGNNILKDYCDRVGIMCNTHLIDGDYLAKSLCTSLLCYNYYNRPHILCILTVDNIEYVVDATPCNRDCCVAYEVNKANANIWVNAWR